MSFTVRNHYVPQWHQRLFLDREQREAKLFYLDLKPGVVKGTDGKTYTKTALRRWGTQSCFCQDNLYTIAFGNRASDVIEKRFFGEVDLRGANALPQIADYDFGTHGTDCLQAIAAYMDAQKLRTPKGLDFLRLLSPDGSHFGALLRMRQLSLMHVTMWMEGVWEILRCDETETKFILSDHPVAAYNKSAFPAGPLCQYPFDPGIELLGTHTLFPLTPTRCLVITNLGYVRNPKISRLTKRENPRFFANTIMFAGNVQTGRQIGEEDVLAINYIMKVRARRYIAAGREEWLYPEQRLKRKMWDRLGGKFFLMPDPRKVSFSTGIFVGWRDGRSSGWDEYGRQPDDEDPRIEAQRQREWKTFHEAQREWDLRFGKLEPGERWRRW